MFIPKLAPKPNKNTKLFEEVDDDNLFSNNLYPIRATIVDDQR